MHRAVHSEVVIIFRVHATFASSRERVWLLGSLPELGEWNPDRAIETGQVEGEWKVWQARVRMPMNTEFQWAWCTLLADGRIKQFESGMRRKREIFSFSGVLHTCWGDPTLEVFQQKMASAQLTIQKKTKKGDVVAVVGSCPNLGCWDPAKACVAIEYPPKSGNWSVTVYYDGGAMLEWNWVIISNETKQVKLTEKLNTRFLFESHGWIKLHAPWNKAAQAIDWTARKSDGSGDYQMGTVELLNITRDRKHEIRRWEEKAESTRATARMRGSIGCVTATLQLDTPRPPRIPPSPRLIESPSFPAEWAESHTPDEEGKKSPVPPKPLLPSIKDDFKPILQIKPFREGVPPSDQTTPPPPPPTRQERMMIKSPFFQSQPSASSTASAPPRAPVAAPTIATAPSVGSRQAAPEGAKPAPTSPTPSPPQRAPAATPPPKPSPPPTSPLPMLSRQVPPQYIHKAPAQKPTVEPAPAAQQKPPPGFKQPAVPPQPGAFKEAPVKKDLESSEASVGADSMIRRGSTSSQTKGSLVSRMSCGLMMAKLPGDQTPVDTEQRKDSITEQEAPSRQASKTPMDITKAGYTLAPCPSKDIGPNRSLVSDPGRPGFTEGLAQVHVSMLTEHRENLAPIAPAPTPFTSPPVRRTKEEDGTSSRKSLESGRKVSNTSLGILGAACDKPQPDLEDLRSLSEQRAQAHQSDRMKGVMDREERNRIRFEQNKQLEAAQMAQPATRVKRSKAPKKDMATET